MMLDYYKDQPYFPFHDYYKSVNQYIDAQKYWFQVLRVVKGFREEDWQPVMQVVDIPTEQLAGRMFWIRNESTKKEIMLHTNSYDGAVFEYMQDNQGMTKEDVQKAIDIYDYQPSEAMIKGATKEESEMEVNTYYQRFSTWVELNDYFHEDPTHPEKGYDVPIERLILSAEISEHTESKAIQALELFMQEGSTIECVNRIFAPEDE